MPGYLLVIFIIYYLYARIIEKRSLVSRIIQDSLSFFDVADYKIEDHNNDRISTTVKLASIEGCDTYYIKNTSDKVIIYLHGGAYLHNLQKPQLMMLENIADRTEASVYIPLYPLVPRTYRESYAKLLAVYREIIKENPDSKIILMGDSAGGGLCLGLNILINENKLKKPHQLILVSPWLDLSLCNSDIDEKLKQQDKILNQEKLQAIARVFSDNDDSHLLNPLKFNPDNIAQTFIISGTYDILYPDTKLLFRKLDKVNKCDYLVYEKMLHDFIIFPMPESRDAINRIVKIINSC